MILNTKKSNKDFKTLDGVLCPNLASCWCDFGQLWRRWNDVGECWASGIVASLVLHSISYTLYTKYCLVLYIVQVFDKWKSCKYNSSLFIIHDMIYSISSTLFRTTLVQFYSWAIGMVASTVHHSIWYTWYSRLISTDI